MTDQPTTDEDLLKILKRANSIDEIKEVMITAGYPPEIANDFVDRVHLIAAEVGSEH